MFPDNDAVEAAFTFESERTGIIEDPPFRILMMGDWSGDEEGKPLAERRPIEIDRDNFDDVMERLTVRLNTVAGSDLEFKKLDDFHPDEIFTRLPVFSELRDLRKRLRDDDSFYAAAREVRSWSPEKEPAENEPDEPGNIAPAPSENLLDAILSEPGGGAPAPKHSGSDELNGLISDLVRPHLVLVDENEQAGLIAAVDEATSSTMRQILHDHAFQELEAAWRGLYFQVRRTETSTDLKIYILDISKDELTGELKSAEKLSDSRLYEMLVESVGDEPWSLVCGNYGFEANIDDIAALMRVAQIAESANAPFISHMRPDVLGVHSLAEHPHVSEWTFTAEKEAGKLWGALREQPSSKYLGLTIPRFLARLPYGADTDPLETFAFEEFADGPVHDHYLWANACFVAATLYAQSYRQVGWQMGNALVQDIEGLPVHIYEQEGETIFKPCAEIQLTENGAERLMEYGLMPLVSYRSTDRVKLARFQSVADPVTGLRGRWT